MNMPLTENDIQQSPHLNPNSSSLEATVDMRGTIYEVDNTAKPTDTTNTSSLWSGRLGQWAQSVGVTPDSPFSPLIQIVGLAVFLGLNAIVAGVGASASNSSSDYKKLDQPSWAPPGWLFGPVWTILYIFMAFAAWLVWRAGWQAMITRVALGIYLVQLIPNMMWTWIFFNKKSGAGAFADIAILWLMIATTIVLFWRHCKLAAALLVPYICWVSFATALTIAIWQRNPEVLG